MVLVALFVANSYATEGAPTPKKASETKIQYFPDEQLEFEVVYHWGLIWKTAGRATLTLRNVGDNYETMLTARTISWAESLCKVRDTLQCTIQRDNLRPLIYKKHTHEKNYHANDMVKYSYPGNVVVGRCSRTKPDEPTLNLIFQADNEAYDMLSIFYYLRALDFETMTTEKVTTVFSGKQKETLRVRYVGKEEAELRDKSRHMAYHIKFTFKSDKDKKSSEDLDAWISVDAPHIPLVCKGKVAVGEVRAYFVPQK